MCILPVWACFTDETMRQISEVLVKHLKRPLIISQPPHGSTVQLDEEGRPELQVGWVGEEVRSTSSEELSKGSGPSVALSPVGLNAEDSVPRTSPSLSESRSSVLLCPPRLKSSQSTRAAGLQFILNTAPALLPSSRLATSAAVVSTVQSTGRGVLSGEAEGAGLAVSAADTPGELLVGGAPKDRFLLCLWRLLPSKELTEVVLFTDVRLYMLADLTAGMLAFLAAPPIALATWF
ncbi:hypothetical protein EYF80_029874 [Liparis tanakae]|uniref:Uncharacterized protein n=1 Tax=Liparis tanakae TaxID=230148 RepID=A0A4Z2H212_9TELE|nr:hypothetical protein EYF80_029874 [Liparis tanakae]